MTILDRRQPYGLLEFIARGGKQIIIARYRRNLRDAGTAFH